MSDAVMIAIVLCTVFFMLIIKRIMKVKHPLRSVFVSMLSGVLALVAVNLCSSFTAVSIPISRLSLVVSTSLGIPGVTTLLIMQLLL